MQDDQIVSLFFARSEEAIRQLDVKYGRTCRSLSRNILGSWQDAEECVNDAYLGAWNTIPPQKPSPLLTYICKIVRNLSLRRLRDRSAIKRNAHFDIALQELEGCLPTTGTLKNRSTPESWYRLSSSFWTACQWRTESFFCAGTGFWTATSKLRVESVYQKKRSRSGWCESGRN